MNSWSNQEVPDFEGIINNTGASYAYTNENYIPTSNDKYGEYEYEDVAILCELKVSSMGLSIFGCEASGHGSIGVVVIVNINSNEVEWSMLSNKSNPFSSIEYNGVSFTAVSTTGSCFQFQLPLNNLKLTLL